MQYGRPRRLGELDHDGRGVGHGKGRVVRFQRQWETLADVLEAEVRAALVDRIRAEHPDDEQTRLVPELSLCRAAARVDLAVINGRLTGWEIKTQADSLTRLPAQAEVYSRVFDRVWLAADGRHVPSALRMLPDWWGVVRISTSDQGCRFITVRRSKLNPAVDLPSLVRLLWRDETLLELESLGLAAGLERAPRTVLWDALAAAAPAVASRAQLQRRVRDRLRTRRGWRADR